MQKFSLKYLVFVAFIVLAGITATTFAASIYTEQLFAKYDDTSITPEKDIFLLVPNTAEINTTIEKYKKIQEIKNMFSSMSGGKYTNEELTRYSIAVADEASRHNIDPALVIAIIATESSFRKNVVSNNGAIGMMQLLPSTAFYISNKTEHINLKDSNELFDPVINVRLGVSYLAYLIKKTGNIEHAIIAYNYGPVNLKRALHKNKALPQQYMRSVMKNYDKAKAFTS